MAKAPAKPKPKPGEPEKSAPPSLDEAIGQAMGSKAPPQSWQDDHAQHSKFSKFQPNEVNKNDK